MKQSKPPSGQSTCPFEKTIPPQVYGSDIRAKARKLFEQGAGYKKVARMLGISPQTVRDWGRAFKKGEFTDAVPRQACRYDDAARATVFQMWSEGMSLR